MEKGKVTYHEDIKYTDLMDGKFYKYIGIIHI